MTQVLRTYVYIHSLACPRLLQVSFSFSHPRPFYPIQIAQRAIAPHAMSATTVPHHPALEDVRRHGVVLAPGLFIEEAKWEAAGRAEILRLFAESPAVDAVVGLLEEPIVLTSAGVQRSTHTCCVVFGRVRPAAGASVRRLLAPF